MIEANSSRDEAKHAGNVAYASAGVAEPAQNVANATGLWFFPTFNLKNLFSVTTTYVCCKLFSSCCIIGNKSGLATLPCVVEVVARGPAGGRLAAG
jgi:hypothetical protein